MKLTPAQIATVIQSILLCGAFLAFVSRLFRKIDKLLELPAQVEKLTNRLDRLTAAYERHIQQHQDRDPSGASWRMPKRKD